jgi:hypothetical protein
LLADPASLVILDPQLAFVHSPELDRPEVYVPQAVVHFLESDILTGQRLRDADAIALPADAAVLADESDLEVTGVLDLRKLPRELPQRRAVGRRRRFLAEPFVRSLFVVLAAECVEAGLLRTEVAARRPRCLGLQRLVHALVPAVLLGMRRLDQLGIDAETDPPH